jgi:hypothetical protein
MHLSGAMKWKSHHMMLRQSYVSICADIHWPGILWRRKTVYMMWIRSFRFFFYTECVWRNIPEIFFVCEPWVYSCVLTVVIIWNICKVSVDMSRIFSPESLTLCLWLYQGVKKRELSGVRIPLPTTTAMVPWCLSTGQSFQYVMHIWVSQLFYVSVILSTKSEFRSLLTCHMLFWHDALVV